MATCWQTVTKAIHELGGSASAAQVEMHIGGAFSASHALDRASQHGVVRCTGRGNDASWTLTQKGVDWCENRLRTAEQRRMPGRARPPQFIGLRFVPTWLSALPRGIRLAREAA